MEKDDIVRLIWIEKGRWEEDYSLSLYARTRRGEEEEQGNDAKAEVWGDIESWAEDQEKIAQSRLKALRQSLKMENEQAKMENEQAKMENEQARELTPPPPC